jgi:hypothetical protein
MSDSQIFAIQWLGLTGLLFALLGLFVRYLPRLRERIGRRRMARELGWRNGWKHLR